jgi:drug/metabolite transporter (DMT)-like permease
MVKQKSTLPIVALALASILWGLNTPFIKMGVASIPVPIFMSIRFLIASLIILPFAIRDWRPLKRKDFLLLTLSSIFFISLSAVALNVGLSKTTALNAAVIWLLGPLLLFILSASYLKERLSFKTFIGIVVALAGSLIIIGKPWQAGASGLASLSGNLLVVVSVFCQTISILIAKPLMKKVSTYQATFMSLFPGIVPVALYALTQLPSWNIHATTHKSYQGLIYSTVAVVIANFLFFYALHYKKAQDTGVYQYLDTVAAIAGAWFLLSERPSSKLELGTILVFAGIYLAEVHLPRKVALSKPNG